MDLILAHKRTMKLMELCGLSLSLQTIFATAVSEIARLAIETGKEARLVLDIVSMRGNKKQLQAVISDRSAFCSEQSESIRYARRLADEVRIELSGSEMQVFLNHNIAKPGLLTETKINSFVEYFINERPISPYDELRRKNIQLQELATRLRDSEDGYSQLTDALPLMMFSVENSGKVTFTNKWLRDFLGFNLTQLNAVQCQPFLYPEDYAIIYDRWNRSKEDFRPLHGQIRLKHIDSGDFIWHLLSIVPVRTDTGGVEKWNGFLVDIHAQKLIEQTLQDNSELKAAQQKLEFYQQDLENKILALNRSNHDLEQFAYIASHDLQEPLRKIKTFANLIRRDVGSELKVAKYFAKLFASAERMSSLITGVLEYSRISDKAGNRFEITDLNKVLAQVENDFDSLIKKKKAVVHRMELPAVPGHPLQLHQLFSNLMSNALKFAGAEPVITIAARSMTQDEVAGFPQLKHQNRYALITFRDNGIGFDPVYSEKIFSIFQQLNSRSDYEGTGIGLALCKKVAERHQGLIRAEGRPGEGATFLIYLPVSVTNEAGGAEAVVE